MSDVYLTASQRLAAVDRGVLGPIVCEALAATTVDIVAFGFEQIRGGAGGGGGADASAVYRFSGQARADDILRQWSVVLKVLYAGDENPSGSHYWRREADAYRSGLFRSLPGGLSVPRCLGVWEHPNESCWLWLEDVTDDAGQWPLERYGLVAAQLALFNAEFATGRRIPPWAWLSDRWIRKDLDLMGAQINLLMEHQQDALIRRFLPPDSVIRTLRLWSERETFLTALESLPATLCHHDAFRRNLLAPHEDRADTVLIDWSFVGRSPLGTEIVSLVWVSLVFCEVDATDALEFSDIVFRNYVRGLRDGGWRGSEDQVRLGYTAAAAMRRLGTIGYILPVLLDPSKHSSSETIIGNSMHEWGDRFAEASRLVDLLADQARALINEPGAARH
jgi:hypothetical protein